MHPHTRRTRKSKHLGSFLASPLLLLLLFSPPSAPPPTRAFGFYLSCVQAQASVKRAEETGAASALSSGWETTILRGTLSFSWTLLRGFDPQQMDGEAGDEIQRLGSSVTPFLGSNPKYK